MDAKALRVQIAQLDAETLAALGSGRALRLIEDEHLATGNGGEADVIVATLPDDTARADPAAWLNREAEALIHAYYRTHPLTRRGFDRQVEALLERHGAEAFAAPAGAVPARTLFVDEGTVVAESGDSPRHRYGAYCLLGNARQLGAVADSVTAWLRRGEAYEAYLSMNVCRYNC